MRRIGVQAAVAVLAVTGATALAACGGGSGGSSTSTGPVKAGGSLTYALDEDLAGFNVLNLAENEFVLQEIQDQTLPQVFITEPNLSEQLDTDIVTSAAVTKTSPQTIVYKINPKAVWSDGVPINAADFIYAWQSQSGSPKFKDVGGKPFQPASTAGYNQIKSVTGSNGGKTVTVVMAKPFGDWKSMFAPFLPAHVASKVGFNNGFATFGHASAVSGGPYEIQSYSKGEDLVEVRNPKWWGTPGKLSKIIFRFILNDDQMPPAVQNGEVNMVNPALASTEFFDSVKGISNFTTQVKPGLEFQHMDFNEANPYLALANVRHAIAYGTNRAQMIQRIVDPLNPRPAITPLQNRIYMPTQPQYQDTSGGFGAFSVAKAKALLKSSNMTLGSDGYYHPNFGPQKGQDLTFSISTTSGVPVRAQIEELFQADMKAIGVKINIKNYAPPQLFGTVGPKGEFDIIEFAWVSTPFASSNDSIYCSFSNPSQCGSNWNHYADSKVDKLLTQATVTTSATQEKTLFNQADAQMWKDMNTLPLFQQPQLFGWTSSYGNIVPNTSSVGIPWNAQLWGKKA